MAYLTIHDPLVFTEKIHQTEEEDYLTAELENEIKGALLNNDVFLKALIEEKEKGHLYSKELKEADLLTVQENGMYYVKQAQHTPNEEKTEGYFKVINHPKKWEENRLIFWHPCASSSGGYFNVLIEGRWLGWQQLATLEDLKGLLTSKAADVTQNPESYKSGQIYSVEGSTTVENGHPYAADWTHLTYFVYGDENAENGYKNIVGMDYRGKVYRKSQCWNQWTDWEQLVTLKELEGKADKFYTIFNKNVIQDEDLIGSAFTNKSWCGVGLNLEHAPTSGWMNYLCLDAAATGSDISQVLAMEINGSNLHCYFTNDVKGKQWKRFLDSADFSENICKTNILINTDFSNLISQRGKKSYSGKNQYAFDRWMINSSNGLGTVDQDSTRINLFNNANSEFIEFTQRIELGTIRSGEIYTFSASTQVASFIDIKITGRISKTVQITDQLSFIYTAAERYDSITLRYTGYSYFIKWMKLEPGYVATRYVPPNRTEELLKCQRYFKLVTHAIIGTTGMFTNIALFPIPEVENMRVIPVIKINSNSVALIDLNNGIWLSTKVNQGIMEYDTNYGCIRLEDNSYEKAHMYLMEIGNDKNNVNYLTLDAEI